MRSALWDKENVEPICPLAQPEMQIVVSARMLLQIQNGAAIRSN